MENKEQREKDHSLRGYNLGRPGFPRSALLPSAADLCGKVF